MQRRHFLALAALASLSGGCDVLARRLLMGSQGGGSFIVPPPDPAPELESGPNFEFETALDDQWTLVDFGSGTAGYSVNDAVPGALRIDGPGMGIVRPIPTIPFTVTAYISDVDNDASSYSDCGIMLGEATPGKFIHGCWDVAYIGQFTILGSYWSSTTVWVQNIHTGAAAGAGTSPLPHYSRFVVNSQDDVDGYYSLDGTNWTQWLNGYNPPFTIGSVGLDLHGTGTGFTVDWLRFT